MLGLRNSGLDIMENFLLVHIKNLRQSLLIVFFLILDFFVFIQ